MEKVEELVQKLREAESKNLSAIQALQQRQTIEIARTKQIAAATEKVRREKWVERQTARIKAKLLFVSSDNKLNLTLAILTTGADRQGAGARTDEAEPAARKQNRPVAGGPL